MNIEVSEEIGLQLKQLADERDLTIEELISTMLDSYDVKRRKGVTLADFAKMASKARLSTAEPADAADNSRDILNTRYAEHLKQRGMSTSEVLEKLEKDYPPGSLARFAQVAIKAGISSQERVDTSARSREILNAEFADYIDRRTRK